MTRLNMAVPGVTHARWSAACPFQARDGPFSIRPSTTATAFPSPQSTASSGGSFTSDALPSYSSVQIELLSRTRYRSKLTNSGGLDLTRVTGY